MSESKYKTIFSSVIKPLVSEEKDKYLAIASLDKIKEFIPNIDIKSNKDLLPIAFNAFVCNRVNKNDDVIDTDTTLAIYKNFINKPIDIEHKRSNIVGVILTAGFSEFGSDKPLTEEEVKNKKEPFNVTLGGVIWRIANGKLAEFIEESSDPESEDYLAVSASWELGFSDYKLITLPEGQKNLNENFETVGSEFQDHLRALGGDGLVNGKRLYRMPTTDVAALGIGLTEKPAADVEGIATNSIESDTNKIVSRLEQIDRKLEAHLVESQKVSDVDTALTLKTLLQFLDKGKIKIGMTANMILMEIPEFCLENKLDLQKINAALNLYNQLEIEKKAVETYNKSQKNSSQTQISVVNKEKNKYMAIKNLSDITDETLKEMTASVINDFIKSEILKTNEKYVEEKSKIENELSKASEEHKKLTGEHAKLQETLKTLEATVENLQKEKKEREDVEKFNIRMSAISSQFDLDDEARVAILDEVKALASDEAFEKWMAKAKVLLKAYAKKQENKDNKDNQTNASTVIDDAINNGTSSGNKLPNTTDQTSLTLAQKYQQAFAQDAWEIKVGRR